MKILLISGIILLELVGNDLNIENYDLLRKGIVMYSVKKIRVFIGIIGMLLLLAGCKSTTESVLTGEELKNFGFGESTYLMKDGDDIAKYDALYYSDHMDNNQREFYDRVYTLVTGETGNFESDSERNNANIMLLVNEEQNDIVFTIDLRNMNDATKVSMISTEKELRLMHQVDIQLDDNKKDFIDTTRLSIMVKNNRYLVSIGYPHTYSADNYYFENSDNGLVALDTISIDQEYNHYLNYEKAIDNGNLSTAMEVPLFRGYMDSYGELYARTSKKALLLAAQLAKGNERVEQKRKYLEYGLQEYLIRFNETNDLSWLLNEGIRLDGEDHLTFIDGDYVDKVALINILEQYSDVLVQDDDTELSDRWNVIIDMFRKSTTIGLEYK